MSSCHAEIHLQARLGRNLHWEARSIARYREPQHVRCQGVGSFRRRHESRTGELNDSYICVTSAFNMLVNGSRRCARYYIGYLQP